MASIELLPELKCDPVIFNLILNRSILLLLALGLRRWWLHLLVLPSVKLLLIRFDFALFRLHVLFADVPCHSAWSCDFRA